MGGPRVALPLALLLLLPVSAWPSGDDASGDAAPTALKPLVAPRGLVPSAVLQLPAGVAHAVVVDVDANRLVLVGRGDDGPTVEEELYVAIGKAGADKRVEGDEKTPIGLYHVTRYIDGRELPAIYGVGALPVNYPNAWDRMAGRTGSGIWLHGTDKDDATLMPRSSRGCLTLLNRDFERLLEKVVVGRTPVLVGHGIDWSRPSRVAARREAVLAAIETWRQDWESRDPDAYLRHYSSDFRSDGMDLARWSAHKTRVNRAKTSIEVDLRDIALYAYPEDPDVVVATFRQEYRSNDFDGRRFKHQYWRETPDGWRIFWEGRP